MEPGGTGKEDPERLRLQEGVAADPGPNCTSLAGTGPAGRRAARGQHGGGRGRTLVSAGTNASGRAFELRIR